MIGVRAVERPRDAPRSVWAPMPDAGLVRTTGRVPQGDDPAAPPARAACARAHEISPSRQRRTSAARPRGPRTCAEEVIDRAVNAARILCIAPHISCVKVT